MVLRREERDSYPCMYVGMHEQSMWMKGQLVEMSVIYTIDLHQWGVSTKQGSTVYSNKWLNQTSVVWTVNRTQTLGYM